jgi:hypothetical protein
LRHSTILSFSATVTVEDLLYRTSTTMDTVTKSMRAGVVNERHGDGQGALLLAIEAMLFPTRACCVDGES